MVEQTDLAGGLVGVHDGSGLGAGVDDEPQDTARRYHRVGPQRVVHAQRVLLAAHVRLKSTNRFCHRRFLLIFGANTASRKTRDLAKKANVLRCRHHGPRQKGWGDKAGGDRGVFCGGGNN